MSRQDVCVLFVREEIVYDKAVHVHMCMTGKESFHTCADIIQEYGGQLDEAPFSKA